MVIVRDVDRLTRNLADWDRFEKAAMRLARLLSDRPRRAQVTGKRRHLLSGVGRCGKCGHVLYADGARYRCASGIGKGCGGVAVRMDMLEEYVTGAILDALESPRVQQAVRSGQDTHAPRRAELLEDIRKAQDKRAEARRDWAEDVIDKEDWLDVKQRTDDRIARARKEYDRLTGTSTVCGCDEQPYR